MIKRVLLSWSSGKDSAWTLYRLQQDPTVELIGLLTTFNEAVDRVAMHAVRHRLVQRQADSAGLKLWPVPLPWPCSNDDYEARMAQALQQALEAGVTHMAFGDLFLTDVRDYRIRQLAGSGIEPLFPVWTTPSGTRHLAFKMLDAGLRTIITCVDPKQLDPSFCGRDWDPDFISELPDGVDPCGENGEFHSFVHAGPMFDRSIEVRTGDIVTRDGFCFADLVAEGEDP